MINLEDKKILVLGFARSGYSTAKILNKLGYDVILNAYDDLSSDAKAIELRNLGVEIVDGGHPLELLDNIDLIVKNPGIKYEIDFLQEAIKKNIDIITEIELANTLFNRNPAKIFMGDTGSLALGGILAAISVILHKEVAFLFIGLVYILETLSVIIQVAYFKKTGKRIFKMSPLHHHFELSGYGEVKTVYIFVIIAVISSAIGYFVGVI